MGRAGEKEDAEQSVRSSEFELEGITVLAESVSPRIGACRVGAEREADTVLGLTSSHGSGIGSCRDSP